MGTRRARGPAGSSLFLSCSIVRYRPPLIVTVIMMSLFRNLVPVSGEMGKGKGGGHQGFAVFLQHICSEVNTTKGVVEALRGDSRGSRIYAN